MKFSEIQYHRPDPERLKAEFDQAIEKRRQL